MYSLFGHGDEVDYSTQVKPILNRSCIKCHGGVKKQGGFSVLFREEALGKTKSGKPAIIPGDPEHSDFIARLFRIGGEKAELARDIKVQNPVWRYKFFVQRRAAKKFTPEVIAELKA